MIYVFIFTAAAIIAYFLLTSNTEDQYSVQNESQSTACINNNTALLNKFSMENIIESLEDDTFDINYLDRNKVLSEGENKYKGFTEYFRYKVNCPKELLDKYNIPYIISKSNLVYSIRHKEFDPENGYKEYGTHHNKEYLIIPDLYFKLFYMVNYALPDNKYIIIPLSYIINNTLNFDFISSGFINKQDIEQITSTKFNKQSKQKIDFKWFMSVKPVNIDKYGRTRNEDLPECLSVCGYNNYYALHRRNDYSYLIKEGHEGINVIIPENVMLYEDISSLRTNDGFYKFTVFDDYIDYRHTECYYKTNVITIKKCHSDFYKDIPLEIRNRLLNEKFDIIEYLENISFSFPFAKELNKYAIERINEIKAII